MHDGIYRIEELIKVLLISNTSYNNNYRNGAGWYNGQVTITIKYDRILQR